MGLIIRCFTVQVCYEQEFEKISNVTILVHMDLKVPLPDPLRRTNMRR